MLIAGLIINGKKVDLKEEEIIPYIKKYIESNSQIKEEYERFLKGQMIVSDINYEEFAVRVLGWVIIKEVTVFYPEGIKDLDKMAYLLAGYDLKKKKRFILKNNRYVQYVDQVEMEIQKLGMPLHNSPKNELSFWYPKTSNIGFKTPETMITQFTDEELRVIKSAEFNKFDFASLQKRLKEEAKKKLPNANLEGKWSIDFMYDGSNFVLIDMGLAECSYYYEKVYEKQLALHNK